MLSDKCIIEEMRNGNIVIDPFDERQLGTNSYDCRLGEWHFRGDYSMKSMRIDNPEHIKNYWGEPIDAMKKHDGLISILPGTTILAHTQEVVGGRNGFLAKMHCRSSIARSGLSVCRCAGVGDVGYIGRWTMEVSNHTQAIISIPVNYRICQMIFEEVGETLKSYNGKYGQNAWSPEDMLPKPSKDWDRQEAHNA
jgi:dCTP deaminase